MNPKSTLLFLPFFFVLCSLNIHCKKALEKKVEEVVVPAMLSGTWYLNYYEENTVDVTAKFNGYEFLFHDNNELDGIHAVEGTVTGSWTANFLQKQITTTFPSQAVPLSALTGTWTITSNDWTNVYASANGRKMHLKKK